MTTTLSPPPFEFLSQPAREHRGGHTLEDRLERAWEGLLADGAAACPICRSRMERAHSTAQCTSCGSTLT